MAKDPNASKINIAFTKHITNALIEDKEERSDLKPLFLENYKIVGNLQLR